MNCLPQLLDDAASFDAEYQGGLSNHLPMALNALARLGAGDQTLRTFAAHYAKRLEPAPAVCPWPAGAPWAAQLGQPGSWSMYRDLFWHWLQSEDAGEVLHQALPRLMQGCGGAAFHGLVRTAYAVQAAHRQELADALAYWACRWLELGPAGPAGPAGTETDALAVLRQLRVVASPADLIFQRMQAAAATAHFRRTVPRLAVDASTLPQLATLAAQAYAASGNFTALHLVTSAHAVRVLLPFMDDDTKALAITDYWRAYAAAVCVAGLRAGPPPHPRGWPDILAAARASDDDHVIKLVDSCHEQQQAYGGTPLWQQAATRAVHGLAPLM
jgi:hypothetical protein